MSHISFRWRDTSNPSWRSPGCHKQLSFCAE